MSQLDPLAAARQVLEESKTWPRLDCKHLFNAHRQCQWCHRMKSEIDSLAMAEALLARQEAEKPTLKGIRWCRECGRGLPRGELKCVGCGTLHQAIDEAADAGEPVVQPTPAVHLEWTQYDAICGVPMFQKKTTTNIPEVTCRECLAAMAKEPALQPTPASAEKLRAKLDVAYRDRDVALAEIASLRARIAVLEEGLRKAREEFKHLGQSLGELTPAQLVYVWKEMDSLLAGEAQP